MGVSNKTKERDESDRRFIKNMMRKKIITVCMLVVMAVFIIGCKKKKENQETVDTPTQNVTTVEPEEAKEPEESQSAQEEAEDTKGKVCSMLTGELIDKKTVKKRPYAIIMNNIINAHPQSGTSDAAILYEALAEGGITRFLAIFEDLKDEDGKLLKRIGSCRSARHYFVSIADEYDAIFVHFGETKYATKKISQLGIDTLSGLTGIGSTVFYRDNNIKPPHNAFASGKGILEGTKIKKYRTKYEKGYEGHFTFNKKDTNLSSKTKVNKLTLKYSSFQPYFEYDKKKKVYKRFQFGEKHIDYNTKKQLEFKNIIVQFVHEYNIDHNGYQTMDIENNTGKGYYITNGKSVPITWKKNESTRKMRYYDEDGKPLSMNPGKTFISIFPDSRTNDVVFE